MNEQQLADLKAEHEREEARLWAGLTSEQKVLVVLGQHAYKTKDYKTSATYARLLQGTGLSETQAGAWLITP